MLTVYKQLYYCDLVKMQLSLLDFKPPQFVSAFLPGFLQVSTNNK